MSAKNTPTETTTPIANEGCLSRLVGVCNSPCHPEWNGKYCQCVNCQPVNYCVEDPCLDCTGPADGCEPPDDDDDDANTRLFHVRRVSDKANVSVRVLADNSLQLLWCSAPRDASAFLRPRAQAVALLMALAAGPRANEIIIEEAQ